MTASKFGGVEKLFTAKQVVERINAIEEIDSSLSDIPDSVTDDPEIMVQICYIEGSRKILQIETKALTRYTFSD